MKTIVAIMLLIGMASGFTEGDNVIVAVQTGLSLEAMIGNITSIDDNMVCLNCTGIYKSTMIKGDKWTLKNLTYPQEICIGKSQIAVIKSAI